MNYSITGNELHTEFEQEYQQLRDRFFSRNPEYWPIYKDPAIAQILEARFNHVAPDDVVSQYPQGDSLLARLQQEDVLAEDWHRSDSDNLDLLTFAAATSKCWENPASVENVVSMPSDPAIYGSVLGIIANPNLVHKEYARTADDLENAVVRNIAKVMGYDPEQAAGIFTQGGTFCNLYGYLLGIRKSLPEARQYGMAYTHDYRIINSLGGHYSNTTNLSLLGINIKEKTIRIKVNENNDIDLQDFEFQLESCFRLKCVVPTIMLTMGTTDTFGVDRVKPIWEIRNRLCDKYRLSMKPHIHVDSAIGWTLIFFLSYDFDTNPIGINSATLEGLQRSVDRYRELHYADSFTIDFQKWGYVPYTSSLVMIKEKGDLKYMENDPENFSYFEKETQGNSHLQATIECSRGGVGLFGAYAALKYFGFRGYQLVIAHCLQNANYFRCRLHQLGFVKILSEDNQGPSVAFRIYDPDRVSDPEQEFLEEYVLKQDAEYKHRLEQNNQYHREMFLKRGKIGLYTNWVESIAHTTYDQVGNMIPLPGEKAVFMNPSTTRADIDRFVAQIH